MRKWFLIGGSTTVAPPVPPVPPVPVETYWPKLDFTDPRNSMYSVGGF